jgi:hypothetical protein
MLLIRAASKRLSSISNKTYSIGLVGQTHTNTHSHTHTHANIQPNKQKNKNTLTYLDFLSEAVAALGAPQQQTIHQQLSREGEGMSIRGEGRVSEGGGQGQ